MDKTTTEIKELRREIEALKKEVAQLKKNTSQRQSAMPKRRSKTAQLSKSHARTRMPAHDERLRSQFGSVSLGHPVGLDNEAIDRDLAQEYTNAHGEQ